MHQHTWCSGSSHATDRKGRSPGVVACNHLPDVPTLLLPAHIWGKRGSGASQPGGNRVQGGGSSKQGG